MNQGITMRYRKSKYFIIFNFKVLLITMVLYLLNQFFLKRITMNWVVHGYVNDFLAMGVFLPYSNILLSFAPSNRYLLNTFLKIVSFTLIIGVFWEYITPLYKNSVTDLLDICSYLVGGLVYFFLLWRYQRI